MLLSFIFQAIIYSPWVWLAEKSGEEQKQRPAVKRDLALNLNFLIDFSFQSYNENLLYA